MNGVLEQYPSGAETGGYQPPGRLFENDSRFYEVEVISFAADEYSFQTEKRVRDSLSRIPAEMIIVHPDFSPNWHGMIPTGTIVEINTMKHPDWLGFLHKKEGDLNTDIGCGMAVGRFSPPMTEEEFKAREDLLDRLRKELLKKENGVYLGRGNHFLDMAVSFDDEQVMAVVHTGSFGDKHKRLGQFAGDQARYLKEHDKVVASGIENRAKTMAIIAKVYKRKLEPLGDWVHNQVVYDAKTGMVTIYKGVIQVKDLTQRVLLPSSMGERMVLYTPGPAVNESNLFGVSHGVGRRLSRSEIRKEANRERPDFQVTPKDLRLMVPEGARLPPTEMPAAYNDFDQVMAAMIRYGLMAEGRKEFFLPIAFIGNLKER